jgi:hypothetical protein
MSTLTLFPSTQLGAGAVLSSCGQYRYVLWRVWHPGDPLLNVVGLNPSTADAQADDPTIRRCIRFARDWGYGGLLMTNLCAWRATDPRVLAQPRDVLGPENGRYLRAAAGASGRVLAAWGAYCPDDVLRDLRESVCRLLTQTRDVWALGLTASGHPRHPLYVRADTVPFVWRAQGSMGWPE